MSRRDRIFSFIGGWDDIVVQFAVFKLKIFGVLWRADALAGLILRFVAAVYQVANMKRESNRNPAACSAKGRQGESRSQLRGTTESGLFPTTQIVVPV